MKILERIDRFLTEQKFKIDVVTVHGQQAVNIQWGNGYIGQVEVNHQKKKAIVYLNDQSTRFYIAGTGKEKAEIKKIVSAWLKSKGMGAYKVSV